MEASNLPTESPTGQEVTPVNGNLATMGIKDEPVPHEVINLDDDLPDLKPPKV